MYSDQGWRRPSYIILSVVYFVALATTAVFAGVRLIEVAESTPNMLKFARNYSSAVAPLAAFIAAIALPLRNSVGAPRVWEALQRVLSILRGQLFEEEIRDGASVHDHRVTLFRHRRFRLCRQPFHGWLVPVERGADGTRRSKAAFLAPDDPGQAQGVAGKAFYQEKVLLVDRLPALTGVTSETAEKKYATRTWTTVEYVRASRPRARSYAACRIVVRGKVWGVLVVDSTLVRAKASDVHLKAYAMAAETIGAFLASKG
jgi:hypothetical protein